MLCIPTQQEATQIHTGTILLKHVKRITLPDGSDALEIKKGNRDSALELGRWRVNLRITLC